MCGTCLLAALVPVDAASHQVARQVPAIAVLQGGIRHMLVLCGFWWFPEASSSRGPYQASPQTANPGKGINPRANPSKGDNTDAHTHPPSCPCAARSDTHTTYWGPSLSPTAVGWCTPSGYEAVRLD